MLEKTFDAAAVEPRLYEAWEKSGAFKAGAGKKDGQDSFCIVIPPPNVTGSLHMGHALNNTLQDVMIRYYRMKGRDVLWQPGMDHAGIATQMVVERQLMENQEPNRRSMGREKRFLSASGNGRTSLVARFSTSSAVLAPPPTGHANVSPWMKACQRPSRRFSSSFIMTA